MSEELNNKIIQLSEQLELQSIKCKRSQEFINILTDENLTLRSHCDILQSRINILTNAAAQKKTEQPEDLKKEQKSNNAVEETQKNESNMDEDDCQLNDEPLKISSDEILDSEGEVIARTKSLVDSDPHE